METIEWTPVNTLKIGDVFRRSVYGNKCVVSQIMESSLVYINPFGDLAELRFNQHVILLTK